MSHGGQWQIRIQDVDGEVQIIDVASTATVEQLKKQVNECMPEHEPETMRLLFGGKQLEGSAALSSYGIKNNSLIFLVQRMRGGSTKRAAVPKRIEFIEEKTHNPRDPSVVFTSEKDCIDTYMDYGTPRVKMSCGHAVDPNTLAQYARVQVEQGSCEVRCPVKTCEKVWDYVEIRKVALLNDTECQWFESRMAKAAVARMAEIKQCPGCKCYVERADRSNPRVNCAICTRKRGSVYDFCWQCLQEWVPPARSGVSFGCGRQECLELEIASIRDAPMMKIRDMDVPNRRACPNCGRVVEHNGLGCKNMACTRCKKEFCFLCLEFTENCQKTAPSSWYGKCKKPVAPRQTEIPVWRH